MNKVISTLTIVATVLPLTITSCQKLLKDTPSCIQSKIEEIKAEKVRNPHGSVWQYKYNGHTVYFIPQYCCDIPSVLLDRNCNIICSPDGGLTGTGDGKCPDFFTKRKNEKLIWQDDRR